ncbi:hypothetical protein CEN45_04720 [Fischerella thermalis CCMEE 5198]|jgi:uncharacterized protein HemX|uniref:hypothetical protein n=1 Tax=Fischerella thermalis TaxID=372787 RepID=UPI000C80A83C|nr:hypothetical protein [Fischerella thermalis]PLZ89891.1 hypothetical protein CI594_19315 [Fischerella thermalis CCMEE 5196]PMB26003.1 hypothetical protein CEN45_04720 [Fischerella thermalis CCMEE 5198]PMB52228.1 hypothetical protein CEN39_11000 [Fischerella thermalis CCMEE 5201]
MLIAKAAKNIQAVSVAVPSSTEKPNQATSVKQTNENIGLFAVVFISSLILGFILGKYQSNRYKKQREQQMAQILKEFENLKNQQKMTSNTEEQISIERKKQIEMLERIWNKLE